MHILQIKEKGRVREIELTDRKITLGRLSENDVVLKDDTVSRYHAQLFFTSEGYLLRDLHTKNGTWVNGKKIKEQLLKDGDEVRIGTTILRFLSRQGSIFYRPEEDLASIPSAIIKAPRGHSFTIGEHKKLEIIYNISQAINSIFDVRELTEKVAEEILKIINADRFLLILRDEKSNELIPRIAIGRDKRATELSISKTMVERVTNEGVSILVRNTLEDSRFQLAQSLITRNIYSILCAPLWSKEGIIGLIYVDSNKIEKSFSEDDLDLFTAIGNQVAVAFQNIRMQEKLWEKKKIERELEIASNIQKSFLPRSLPTCHGYNFGVKSIPAKNIGGDFYDCFNLSSKKIGFVVGDVSGKGIPAALYMARFLSEFKIYSVNFSSPGYLMYEMNRKLREIVVGGNFVSAVYFILEPDTGGITYCLAGCHPILFYQNKEECIKELGTGSGQILGVGEGSFYDEQNILDYGDMIITYTDGVIEARNRNKEEFGLERLKDIIFKFRDLSADEIKEKVVESVFEFLNGEDLSDDLTLFLLKRVPIDKPKNKKIFL